MDKNRIEGGAKEVKGTIKEAVGKLVGNEAQTRARVESSTPPPGGGTAGGLKQGGSAGAQNGPGVRSDKGSAAPGSVPPSR